MTGGIVTYVNANSIPVLVDLARDRQSAAHFDIEDWEVGLRASRPFSWYRRDVYAPTFPASAMLKLLHIENRGRM